MTALVVGRSAALTDTGRKRRQNEDAFVCEPPLFAVADGMGGAQAGEVASRLAAAAFEEGAAAIRGEDGVATIVRDANARIFERAVQDPAVAGMGTTATVAVVDERAATVMVAHVGDSRAYLYRDGVLEQLTTDHSLVGELVRSGRLTEDEAAVHPQRSVITRALGTDAEVEVDTLTLDVVAGDLVLLCSDGLSAMVRDEEIVRVLRSTHGEPRSAAAALVAAANAAGGEDNVTVVLFELADGDPDAPTAHAPVTPGPEFEVEVEPGPDGPTLEDVRRHGAGKGSRWPALLLLLAIVGTAAFALWWSLLR
jgi:serine/threonine protein phosphatase PrpC